MLHGIRLFVFHIHTNINIVIVHEITKYRPASTDQMLGEASTGAAPKLIWPHYATNRRK